MYQLECPECGKTISAKTKRCSCGWRKAEPAITGPRDYRCEYVINQRRCPLPGTVCPYPYGNGPWYCGGHWSTLSDPQLGEAVLIDAEKNYHQILEDHRDWRYKLFSHPSTKAQEPRK